MQDTDTGAVGDEREKGSFSQIVETLEAGGDRTGM